MGKPDLLEIIKDGSKAKILNERNIQRNESDLNQWNIKLVNGN